MKNLLLLHGALGSKEQFNSLNEQLKNDFSLHTLSFSGHGEHACEDVNFSIELFCKDVENYLSENKIDSVDIFGYSMGGYVALYFARKYRERHIKIFTLATKFDWTMESAAKESSMLHADTIERKVPVFAGMLAKRHGEAYWKHVVNKTAVMINEMGKKNPLSQEDFTQIKHPVLLGLGDQDKMVGLDETEKIGKLIPNSHVLIMPETPHAYEKVNYELLAIEIKTYFS